jgi:hypothetical protein
MRMITSRCKSGTAAAPDTTDQSDFVARHCTGMEVFTPSHSPYVCFNRLYRSSMLHTWQYLEPFHSLPWHTTREGTVSTHWRTSLGVYRSRVENH